MIDISIIVPIYNAEKYLNRCIKSLLNQTKKELEFILVNDGSKDESDSIVRSYNDSRIKYFKRSNHGIGKTRNFGISRASGKYIMFLDSDDYLKEDACEVLYKKVIKDKLDVAVCDFYKVIDNDEIDEKIISFENTTLKNNPNILLDINLAPWNKIYKSDLIKNNKIKFIEDLKYEDAPFVALSLLKAKKIGKIDKSLIYYTVHNKSETTIRDERVFDIIKIVDIIRNYYKEYSWSKEVVDSLTVNILVNYTIQQRYVKDKGLRDKFIDEVFSYLKKNIKDFKKNKYYLNKKIIRKTIEKNKALTKVYCSFYNRTHK